MTKPQTKPIALIPAAGFGTRLGQLGCSKELVNVGSNSRWPEGRPVIDHVLERLSHLDLDHAKVLIRAAKTDIPETLGNKQHGLRLRYEETPQTPSAVHTLGGALSSTSAASAEPATEGPPLGESAFCEDQTWVLAYPDILLEPRDAYQPVLDLLSQGFDLALGLFPSHRPDKSDMVEVGEQLPEPVAWRHSNLAAYRIAGLRIKQPDRGLRYTWSAAAWNASFAQLLLAEIHSQLAPDCSSELYVGHVIERALERGLNVAAVAFPDGRALDVGTPEDLDLARKLYSR